MIQKHFKSKSWCFNNNYNWQKCQSKIVLSICSYVLSKYCQSYKRIRFAFLIEPCRLLPFKHFNISMSINTQYFFSLIMYLIKTIQLNLGYTVLLGGGGIFFAYFFLLIFFFGCFFIFFLGGGVF